MSTLRSFLSLPDLLAYRCQDCFSCLACCILKQLRGKVVQSADFPAFRLRTALSASSLSTGSLSASCVGGLVTLEQSSVWMEFVVV